MQLLIDATDLAGAPAEVKGWILGRLDREPTEYRVVSLPEVGSPYPGTTPSTEKVEATETPPVTLLDVQRKATELIESKGKEVAKQVLATMGIKKFTDCPADKLAACLAEIAKVL